MIRGVAPHVRGRDRTRPQACRRIKRATGRTRTDNLRITNALRPSLSTEYADGYDDSDGARNSRRNSDAPESVAEAGPGLGAEAPEPAADEPGRALAAALGELPEAEREAVAEHVRALARLSPRRRSAILALTDDETGL